jgi:hypothetical protein
MYQLMFLTGAGGGPVLVSGLGDGASSEGIGDGSDDPDADGLGSASLRKLGSAAQPHTSKAGRAASKERRGIGTQQSVVKF